MLNYGDGAGVGCSPRNQSGVVSAPEVGTLAHEGSDTDGGLERKDPSPQPLLLAPCCGCLTWDASLRGQSGARAVSENPRNLAGKAVPVGCGVFTSRCALGLASSAV